MSWDYNALTFTGFMYLLNSRGSYRKVSSLRTADFVATLDRSSGHESGPRKPSHRLSELQFAPNAAIQRGEQTVGNDLYISLVGN